jgi:hypothetical protein
MVMVARGERKAATFSSLAEIVPVAHFLAKESWEEIVCNLKPIHFSINLGFVTRCNTVNKATKTEYCQIRLTKQTKFGSNVCYSTQHMNSTHEEIQLHLFVCINNPTILGSTMQYY